MIGNLLVSIYFSVILLTKVRKDSALTFKVGR